MFFFANDNYVSDLRNILGRGSYGDVYMGYKLCNGDPVAIKVLKKTLPLKNLLQESEILSSIEHENIVRLISAERHPRLGNCLIMEACLEGSLLNVLENPENYYGLSEDEFFLLLVGVTQGMKYLRSKNIIHRDIKPGNILRSRNHLGQYIYKLTDFDSARFLEEGECFTSIYGTEEYLSPDMYTSAFHRMPSQCGKFNVTIDLWSIGVTFYQAATRAIPFQAFFGRKDRNTTLKILSTKPEGVISGNQLEPNGPIVWERDLPETCQFNSELKAKVTSLLSRLLERNSKLNWSFDDFFREVDEIVSLKKVVVFYVNRLKFLVVYIKSEQNYADLQEALTKHTAVACDDQLLASKCGLLSISNECLKAGVFPSYTKNDPLILFSMKAVDYQGVRLNFLNINARENRNAKELVANEYINGLKINDLSVVINLCKNVKKLFGNIILQQQRENELKINFLTTCRQLLIQGIQNFYRAAGAIENDRNLLEIKSELENLEQCKADKINIVSNKTTLEDGDGTIDNMKNSIQKVLTLTARIRAHRNLMLSENDIECKQLCMLHLVRLAENLTQFYSHCENDFESMISHMKVWCENTMSIFFETGLVQKRIKKWQCCNEKLVNMLNYVVTQKQDHFLSKQLHCLKNISKETSELMLYQASIIEDLDCAIVAFKKNM